MLESLRIRYVMANDDADADNNNSIDEKFRSFVEIKDNGKTMMPGEVSKILVHNRPPACYE